MSMKSLSIVIWVIVLNFILSAQQKLTLQDAIEYGVKNNLKLSMTQSQKDIYEQNIKQSYGNLMPDFKANAGYSYATTKNVFGKNSGSNYSAGLSSNVILFDGLSNLYSIDRNKLDYEIFQNQLERLKQQIAFNVSELFYNTLSQYYLMKVEEESIKWNEKNLEYIKEKYNLGAANRADLYNQELKLGLAKSRYISAKNAYQALRDQLVNLIGLDILEDYELVSPQVELDTLTVNKEIQKYENINNLINEAFANRKDYKNNILMQKLNDMDYKIAVGNYYPILSAGWNFNFNSDKFSNFGKYYNNTFSLNLSIPIFNRFYTDTRVEQYKVNSVIKEIEKLDAERTIKVDIKKNLLDLKNASENYIVSMKNVQFATENKRIVEERYKLGAETLMNVLLAETDFVNAQTQKITAVFEFYKNLEKIKYLTGK